MSKKDIEWLDDEIDSFDEIDTDYLRNIIIEVGVVCSNSEPNKWFDEETETEISHCIKRFNDDILRCLSNHRIMYCEETDRTIEDF